MKRKLIFTIFFLWALIASTSVSYAQYGKGVGATKARISRTRGLANRPSYAKTGFRFTIDIDNGFAFPNDENQNDLGDNPHKPFYELTGTIGCGYQLNPFFYLGVVGGSGFATIETSQPIHIDNWTYEYIFDKKRVMKYLVALDMKAYFRPTRITPMVSAQLGYINVDDSSLYASGGLGARFAFQNKKGGFNLQFITSISYDWTAMYGLRIGFDI